ncbi:helix-turn-helix transcriptional regulator [Tenacibaculum sp. nBUS_03]|uniref:helix-turn-helix transcriptional regulator n=1 Tax=Tenacibaculum sp. nBUS_03 TaxID=3395320 RepID=UPI003EBFC7CC
MITTVNKSTKNEAQQQIVAGFLPSDSNIEFAGIKNTKEVVYIQNGKTHQFSDLPLKYVAQLKAKYNSDKPAQEFLSKVTSLPSKQLELYTYYLYGAIDTTPDILDGVLQEPENFRDSDNCPSMIFKHKVFKIQDYILTPREILITDFFKKDLTDKRIADSLNISHSYLDYLKRELFKKCGVTNKTAFVLKAQKYGVIQL